MTGVQTCALPILLGSWNDLLCDPGLAGRNSSHQQADAKNSQVYDDLYSEEDLLWEAFGKFVHISSISCTKLLWGLTHRYAFLSVVSSHGF